MSNGNVTFSFNGIFVRLFTDDCIIDEKTLRELSEYFNIELTKQNISETLARFIESKIKHKFYVFENDLLYEISYILNSNISLTKYKFKVSADKNIIVPKMILISLEDK